ncbi:MAG: AAA family ATPase [Thermoflexibacter sp.]|jgi:predicted ATPase|nr:AAA family ATPase [Thermoflexibacter sp.]
MLQEITIKNFKSIAEDTIELGRVNVFIGENGCGKSNILEAVGFASALENGKIELETLVEKGIRVAKPSLMRGSFSKNKNKDKIEISLSFSKDKKLDLHLIPNSEDKDDIYANWIEEELVTSIQKLTSFYQNIKAIGDEKEFLEVLKNVIPILEKNNQGNDKLSKESSEMLSAFKGILPLPNAPDDSLYFSDYFQSFFSHFVIYSLSTPILRGLLDDSNIDPVGIYGGNLDVLIANFDKEERKELLEYNYLIDWLDSFVVDTNDILKLKGYKLNRSQSTLYFTDKYMMKKNNIFSSENANEGILHVLFYLALMISKRTPKFFAIDNIESSLNPHLCRHLMTELCKLAKKHDKQLLITTHNPAILDGLNLFDEEVRLFVVSRNKTGHTKTRRVKLKPDVQNKMGEKYKLSELWTRGYLGAISENF